MDSSQWFFETTRGRGWRSICVCTLAFIVMNVASAAAALPDLVSDPPANAQLGVYVDDGGGQRLLLRFDSYVHNVGPGPLEVRFPLLTTHAGDPSADTAGAAEQVVQGEADPRPMPGAELIFENRQLGNEDGHDHWHLQRVAKYELALPGAAGGLVASEKVGFCLLDSLPVEARGTAPHFTSECRRAPGGTAITMGVSAGWRDLYTRNLAHQWVDVSDVVPGTYALRAEIDPENVIAELNEANPASSRAVVVPGYVARPRSGASAVVLDAAAVAPASGAL
ncbi:MAG TPA: lysyl oxidase family protein, partial [Solirubrobacteraceae bacterium]|nr:lysyl oxidase family protein [Solirubrobacteraceae bacterium]